METIEVIFLCALNMLSFVLGAKIGQKTAKGEEIKLPTLNPVKIYEEYKNEQEYKDEQEKDRIIAANIDNYDGTSFGQQDLPK